MSDEDFLSPAQFPEEPQVEDTTPEPAPEIEVAQEKPAEPATVPLAALQSERAENKSLKSRIPLLEQKIESLVELVKRATTPPPEPLDPVADPQRFAQVVQMQMAALASNTNATISERLTRNQHGDELVDEAFSAAQQAGVIDQFRGQKDPWGELVKWHKAQRVAAEIGSDPDAYKARLKAELMAEIAASSGQVMQSAPKAAPSLAAQPNLGTRQSPAWSGPTPLDDILGAKGSSF